MTSTRGNRRVFSILCSFTDVRVASKYLVPANYQYPIIITLTLIVPVTAIDALRHFETG